MTKAEKNKIFDLAMKYDFAAGLHSTNKYRRTKYHFDAMYRLMEELGIEDGYQKYVNENEDQLEEWERGKFWV